MTFELSLLISGISVAFAIYFGLSSKKRNDRKDIKQETEEHTLLMTKLENIADDVKDIKRDYRETNIEVQNLRERVVAVEQSLKSYHKRLDEKNDQ